MKSSVDYIKRLLRERERFKGVDSQNKALEEKNKQLTLRVQVSLVALKDLRFEAPKGLLKSCLLREVKNLSGK